MRNRAHHDGGGGPLSPPPAAELPLHKPCLGTGRSRPSFSGSPRGRSGGGQSAATAPAGSQRAAGPPFPGEPTGSLSHTAPLTPGTGFGSERAAGLLLCRHRLPLPPAPRTGTAAGRGRRGRRAQGAPPAGRQPEGRPERRLPASAGGARAPLPSRPARRGPPPHPARTKVPSYWASPPDKAATSSVTWRGSPRGRGKGGTPGPLCRAGKAGHRLSQSRRPHPRPF